MKIGQKICWSQSHDLTDATLIQEGTITARRAGKDSLESTVWIDGFHKAEDCIYEMYCWPIEAKEELVAIHIERKMLKKAFDESMALVFRLRNKFSELSR